MSETYRRGFSGIAASAGRGAARVAWLAVAAAVPLLVKAEEVHPAASGSTPVAAPTFVAAEGGGYTFDTGVLEGKLNVSGKALGLTDVTHKPSGRSIAGRYGLLHLYRIFSGSRRFGNAARDWPTKSRLLDDGSVEIRYLSAEDRPFELRAVYRWHNAQALDVLVTVAAESDLPAFEVFLSSYFDAGFADPFIYVEDQEASCQGPVFLLGERVLGHWMMAPRDDRAVAMIRDGRWRAEPNPVDWAILPKLVSPIAVRRDRKSELVAAMMAPRADCFAVSMPFAGETHYSLYLSLFGYDVAAGREATARARLLLGAGLSNAQIAEHYEAYDQKR